jgi:hypothetical protein
MAFEVTEGTQLLELGPALVFSTEPQEFNDYTELNQFIEAFVLAIYERLDLLDTFDSDEQLAFQFILRGDNVESERAYISTLFVFTPFSFFEVIHKLIDSIELYENEGIWITDSGVDSGDVNQMFNLDVGLNQSLVGVLKVVYMQRTLAELIGEEE